jgi:hypothetical protein
MVFSKGFRGGLSVSAEDKAHWEKLNQIRRAYFVKRGPLKVVMIHSNEGKTQDTVTGTPPAFKADARSAWAKRRDDASIEGLFK